jgi:peptidoglycan/xylan/chitin deacetylase (PgdA/CDA1 family)
MTRLLPRAVVWHYVRAATATPRVGYWGVQPDTFATQLDAICADHEPIGWPALEGALRTGHTLPDDAVVLTFDDGLADHHRTVLPELTKRGLPAIFFVLARAPGESLTLGHRLHVLLGTWSAEQVRLAVMDRLPRADQARYASAMTAMLRTTPADADDIWKRPLQRELARAAGPILSTLVAEVLGPEGDIADALYLAPQQSDDLVDAGMTLGGHGRAHLWLDAIDPVERRGEVDASATFLAARAPAPWPFAYPFGGVPRGAASMLGAAGFTAAFTTDPDRTTDRYGIGRLDGDDPDVLNALARAAIP